jgi:DNA polymerase III epsilon subunit-like protein
MTAIPWKTSPWATLDTETTGLDVENDAIREIGISWRGGKLDGSGTSVFIRPWKPIPDDLIAKLGITREYLEHLETCPPFSADLGRRLLADLEGTLLVGYNLLRYDLPLLAAELRRVGLDPAPLLERPAVDVLVLAAELLEQASSLRLEPVAASLGVACPGAHGARADVRMTEAILVALAPKLPDELEQLLAFQAEATRRQEEDRERFGGWLRRSRQEPGRLRLARGKRRGDFLDELAAGVTADRGYLSWVLGLADLPDEVRRVITEALR